MTTLQPYRVIAAAPWQQARHQPTRWLLGIVLALSLAPVLAAVDLISWQWAWRLAEVVMALMVLVGWLVMFSSLRQQNHPTLAHLLPGQPARLREVLLTVYWAASLLAGLLLSDALTGPWWPFVGFSAATLAATAMAMRWPLWWVIGWIPVQLAISAWQAWPEVSAAARSVQPILADNPLLAVVCLGGLLSLGVTHLLQAGGAAHQHAYAVEQRRNRVMRRSGAGQTTVKDSGALMLGAGRAFQVIYRRWLAHLCAHPRTTPRHTLARVEMAYTIGNHWTVMVVVAALIVGTGGLMALIAHQLFEVDLAAALQQGAATGMLFGLMASSMSMLLSFRQSMYRGRREQALLRLLPGVPQGAALNRWVSGRLLAQLLAAWVMTAGGVAVFVGWVGAPRWILGCAVLALPFGLGLLRDWSTLKPPATAETTWLVLAMIGVCGAGGGFAARGGDLSLGLMSLALVPVLLVAGVWRWRRLDHFAPALPAGRAA
jgi:hypothetical protein